MSITVKEVGVVEEKSVQEQEQEYQNNFEKSQEETTAEVEESKEEVEEQEDKVVEEQPLSLKDEDVLKFIADKYPDREISSIDDLLKEPEVKVIEPELNEGVKALMDYMTETGRGVEDYVKLNRDYNSMPEDALLAEWIKSTEKGFDDDDARDVISEKYTWDEDDDESDIKAAKRARKKAVVEAKEFFENQKAKYKEPLESRTSSSISEEDRQKLEAYQQYIQQSDTLREQQQKTRDWYVQKTDELFSEKFEGFEFDLGDKKVTYSPSEAAKLKELQLDTNNFTSRFIDKETGLLKDPSGFHKALAVGMNADKIAKHFYDLGKSEGVESYDRKIKNVDMQDRQKPQTVTKGGVKVTAINPSSGNGLKIRSKR